MKTRKKTTTGAQTGGKAAGTRNLDSLFVELELAGLVFFRQVYPIKGTTVAEILAAMSEDPNFHNPLEQRGRLEGMRDGKLVDLARFDFFDFDGSPDATELITAVAHYKDGTRSIVLGD